MFHPSSTSEWDLGNEWFGKWEAVLFSNADHLLQSGREGGGLGGRQLEEFVLKGHGDEAF